MKTTIYIRDDLYRRAKAQAALEGRTLRALIEDALTAMIERAKSPASAAEHWLDRLPSVPRAAAKEVDALVNASDFRQIEGGDWE